MPIGTDSGVAGHLLAVCNARLMSYSLVTSMKQRALRHPASNCQRKIRSFTEEMSAIMRFGFVRTLGLCMLAALVTSAIGVDLKSQAKAGNCSCEAVGEVCDCAGRVLGIGWSDGYHACKSSGRHCIADLPPKSYAAYRRHQATSCRKTDGCATIYDHFDTSCGSRCDRGCDVACDGCECDSAVGCEGSTDSLLEVSPSDMHAAPIEDVSDQPSKKQGHVVKQADRLNVAAKQVAQEPVFRRFVATMTPKNIVPVHPYEKQAALARMQGRTRQTATESQPESGSAADAASRVYPTLVAPPRAERVLSDERRNLPAMRQFERAGVSSTLRGGPRTRLNMPESIKTYSTLSEIEGRTANAVGSEMHPLPLWVLEVTEETQMMPQHAAMRGTRLEKQQATTAPLLEIANRRRYPVDNVIRQPDIQR